ncbi:MAG: hypothetical protein KQI35_08720 [Bacteroidetes bacterium]|nr:hypothetical protein [Bacteroidota bacterium]
MLEKFKYEYDASTGILFKFYYGIITISDIETSWIYAFENHIIPDDVTGFVLDYRNATFEISRSEYIAIPEFYRKHLTVFGNKKIAIITENPRDIVIPLLVEREDEGYMSKPFSTREAAIHWVLR